MLKVSQGEKGLIGAGRKKKGKRQKTSAWEASQVYQARVEGAKRLHVSCIGGEQGSGFCSSTDGLVVTMCVGGVQNDNDLFTIFSHFLAAEV